MFLRNDMRGERRSILLVVGDSYASSYPDMVTDALGWNLAVDMQDGTGFVDHADKPSPAHPPFIERLDRDAAYPALARRPRSAAESVGVCLIDPVAQQWYRGNDVKQLLWNDGVNLNSDDNAYYANKIIENLTRMGIAS
jgi:hypothetical protein